MLRRVQKTHHLEARDAWLESNEEDLMTFFLSARDFCHKRGLVILNKKATFTSFCMHLYNISDHLRFIVSHDQSESDGDVTELSEDG